MSGRMKDTQGDSIKRGKNEGTGGVKAGGGGRGQTLRSSRGENS